MSNGLTKLLALVRRTGDRCIVVDQQGNPEFVLMSPEQYEELLKKAAIGAESAPETPEYLFEKPQNTAENQSPVDTYEFEPIE